MVGAPEMLGEVQQLIKRECELAVIRPTTGLFSEVNCGT